MIESFYSLSPGSPMAFLLMLLVVLFLAFYFHRRAGSSYGFFNRIYALLMGGKEFHNEEIARFWKERRDVERFNALFNVGAKSTKDIIKFKNWVEEFGIDLRLVANLRGRIDLEELKVVEVKWWEPLCNFFGLILFSSISFLTFTIAFSSSALLKFKGEEQWFWLNPEEAYSTWFHEISGDGDEWVITKQGCENSGGDYESLVLESGPDKGSVSIICNYFFDKEEVSDIDEIIKEQKAFFAPAVFSFLIALVPSLDMMAILRALVARRHIRKKCYSRNGM